MKVVVQDGIRTIVLSRDEFLGALNPYLTEAAPAGHYRDITVTILHNQAIITMAAEPDGPSRAGARWQ